MITKQTALLAAGAALALSSPAYSAGINVSGFVDVVFVLSDGETAAPATSPIENKFLDSAELDFKAEINAAASARIDVDYVNNLVAGLPDPLVVEQAMINWNLTNGMTVKAGKFNNPIGWEKEDAPDMYQITHGQIWDILDNQTTEYGNNLVGVSVSGKGSGFRFEAGLLNDLNNTNEENSIMGVVGFKAGKSLDLSVGAITQDLQMETLIDVNATFKQGPLTVGAEVMMAGNTVDLAIAATAAYQVNNRASGTLRFDSVSWENPAIDDTTGITLAGSYTLSRNVLANAEIRIGDNQSGAPAVTMGDGELIQLEIIATF